MTVVRNSLNPIVRTWDVKPSLPDFRVLGEFNAGVATCGK